MQRENNKPSKARAYRVLANLTQEEMAKELGISVTAYRTKESGDREFTQSEMNAFVKKIKTVDDTVTLDTIFS